MKKILVPAVLLMLTACKYFSPSKGESGVTLTDTVVREINSPYPVIYSSKFVQGNPKNAENILTLWKDYDNGNLSAHKELFADSVSFYLADGAVLYTGRDSIIAAMQRYRDGFKAVTDHVFTVNSIRSIDQNEDWVTIWGMEADTQKNGTIDSVNLMETWRLNKDGKANLIYQYKMQILPQKK